MEGGGVNLPSCAVPSQRGKPGADLPVWYPFHHSAPTMQILARGKKEEENEKDLLSVWREIFKRLHWELI